jgi:uncharacterized protein
MDNKMKILLFSYLILSISNSCVSGKSDTWHEMHSSLNHEKLVQLAENGNVEAQMALGYVNDLGLNISQSKKNAFKWYFLAAKNGHPDGMLYTGICYLSGKGVDKNFEEAIQWLLKAEEHKVDDASQYLGEAYEASGKIELATICFKKSANLGNSFSQLKLGKMYLNSSNGEVKKNGIEYLWQAFGGLQYEAGLLLAEQYMSGEVVPKNPKSAQNILKEILKHKSNIHYEQAKILMDKVNETIK